MRLQQVFFVMLFVAFFLLAHFGIRAWVSAVQNDTLVCNAGGPFGLVFPNEWIIKLGGGVCIFLVWLWMKQSQFLLEWPWVLLLAGGLGNLLERILFGCIMDYVSVPFFPTFNGADVFLTLGVVGILIQEVRKNARV